MIPLIWCRPSLADMKIFFNIDAHTHIISSKYFLLIIKFDLQNDWSAGLRVGHCYRDNWSAGVIALDDKLHSKYSTRASSARNNLSI
eukprot:m.449776 g.449776  ORF g.449776 m.449776 type:complete len:87 (-) comp21508_c0_seq28:1028-1288(-)